MANKPKIHVIGTGGTISGAGDTATAGAYKSGSVDAAQLIAAVDGLDALADVSAETMFATGSENLGPVQWRELARRIEELTASDDVDGVVVTHGTDTLEEAAFFLDLVCRPKKPVALTAAMRPATALSADGPANLFQAALSVTSPLFQGDGVVVVMNGQVIAGWQAIKTDSVALESFCSYPGGPVGRVVGEKTVVVGGHKASPLAGRFHGILDADDDLPVVDIVALRGGCGDRPLSNANTSDCKGLVIAGFGAGTMPEPLAAKAIETAGSGTVVVVSSRVGRVMVSSHSTTTDAKDGIIPSGFLNSQKSAVLLSLALMTGLDGSEIAGMFEHFSG
ncbi:MAG: asparaginase [Rhodospirillales bacterium]|jgi:L-asparaginase|nr:asparaginase [Rhodospirillales bacterium]